MNIESLVLFDGNNDSNDSTEISPQQAVDGIIQLVDKYTSKLSEEQLKVLPLIGYGMTVPNIAKKTGIPAERIRMWKQTDFAFRQAIVDFRDSVHDFHMVMLNQAATMAWDKIFDFLSMDSGDPKTMLIQANIAQFAISQLGLKTTKSEIRHEVEPQLQVTESSAAIIAKKLKELDAPVDAVDAEYRISTDIEDRATAYNSMRTAEAMDEVHGEDFDAEIKEAESPTSSQYIMSPECEYGILNFNENTHRWQCHICGHWTTDLVVHVRTEHKLSPARYRKMYGIPDTVKFYMEKPRPATEDEIEDANKDIEA